MRKRTIAGGAQTVQIQCVSCGKPTSSAIKKSTLTPEAYAALPLFDDALLAKGRDSNNDLWQARRAAAEQEKLDKEKEWWANYNAYLKTPEWRAKSAAVLQRDGYVCQGCLKNRATQAHHLTYKRVFSEPLFDLVAICKPCHENIHPDRFQ